MMIVVVYMEPFQFTSPLSVIGLESSRQLFNLSVAKLVAASFSQGKRSNKFIFVAIVSEPISLKVIIIIIIIIIIINFI